MRLSECFPNCSVTDSYWFWVISPRCWLSRIVGCGSNPKVAKKSKIRNEDIRKYFSSQHVWSLYFWKALCPNSCSPYHLYLCIMGIMWALLACASCPACAHENTLWPLLSADWWAVNRCNKLPDWQLIPLICDNRLVHAHIVPLKTATVLYCWVSSSPLTVSLIAHF